MSSRASTGRKKTSERRVSDYFLVVREHWKATCLTALLIFCAFAVWTLLATPVYETRATIQIKQKGAQQAVLVELSGVDTDSSVETEMEVMRSFKVALGATEAFSLPALADKENPPSETSAATESEVPFEDRIQLTAICWEKNAYRPLASLMRILGRRGSATQLRVRTREVPTAMRHLELSFSETGKELTVVDVGKTKAPDVHVKGFKSAQPFEAFGMTLTVKRLAGRLSGRTFELRIRPATVAARWILAGRTIKLIGKRTGIASIAFAARTPEIAQDVANALARSYLRLRRQERDEDLQGTIDLLKSRQEEVGKRLKKAQDKQDDFTKDNRAFQLRARAATLARDQVELEEQSADLTRRVNEAKTDLKRWEDYSFEERFDLLVTTQVDAMTRGLAADYSAGKRELEFNVKVNGWLTTSESVKDAQALLDMMRKELDDRLKSIAMGAIERFKRDIKRLESRLEQNQKLLEAGKKDIADYPEIERRLAEMNRVVKAEGRSLQSIMERKLEVEISMASKKIAARSVDDAQPPTERKSPKVAYMLILGALFGLLGGIGVAFLLDALDQKVRSPDELESELGLTSYASIPAFSSVRRRDRKALQGSMAAIDAPKSVIAEAYRSLRANIRFATKDKKVQALAITSALAGEGKTVTTLNLGVVMAQGGSSVIVIDADMRRSTVHEYMGLERESGLAEVLTEERTWKDIVQHSQVPKLDILSSGARHASPGALLDSEAFQGLLKELREHYDYVLIDMPPVLAVSDAAPFFSSLDGVLLLSRAGRCPVGVYRGALDQVERLGGNVIGTIFNGFDARRVAGRGYGYGGYYGYHAYYAYDEGLRKKRKAKSGSTGSTPQS